ncbi:MAG TPA: hypothetical protein VFK85_12960 [Anaeromyxobacteraceae bacterium]|nr:hypothetical protein [Anaeromyxobacteraceae bacterium]
MPSSLMLTIPEGSIIATSLDSEAFARHRSPGAGRYFEGKAVYVELPIEGSRPGFAFAEEGGWRDAATDTAHALAAVADGRKRTKTALSNGAFSVTPIDAFRAIWIAKTGGEILPLHGPAELLRYASHSYAWGHGLSSDEVAKAAGTQIPTSRRPRLYMILAPIGLVVLSNLTPEEYGWYATHRPGKLFRQVMFTELSGSVRGLVADSVYVGANAELVKDPSKKTKTVYAGNVLNRVPYQAWVGYQGGQLGGIYVGNRDKLALWKFPDARSSAWDRAE